MISPKQVHLVRIIVDEIYPEEEIVARFNGYTGMVDFEIMLPAPSLDTVSTSADLEGKANKELVDAIVGACDELLKLAEELSGD